jgi:hypothetical protein
MKRRRQGVVLDQSFVTARKPVTGTSIVRPVTAKQKRWHAMRERMGLEP